VKYLCCILLVFSLVSCKSKAVFVKTNPALSKGENVLSSETIIQNHYSNKNDFSTLYIRSKAKYSDEKSSQDVTAEIKIKRDEKILVSIRFLGVTMAKALITPQEVKYYEKINGIYFEGDYEKLSQWLGTDLDFNKVQNMLIGRPFDDLTKENFISTVSDKFYKLSTFENNTEKSFFFEGEHYLLKKQAIVQPEKERMFEVNYPNFQDFASAFLPAGLMINATQKKGKTTISIEYNSVTFDEELSFPYSVPDGYERISIN